MSFKNLVQNKNKLENSAGKFYIRPAAPNEADLIVALATTTFYETYFELDKPLDLAHYIAKNFNPAKIQSELSNPDSTFFISFFGEKAIGYVKLRENSRVDCIAEKNVIELQRIYILQKMLGNGFGEKMLRHCLEKAAEKGYRSIWLSVWEYNLKAQSFYEKQGFTRVGTMPYPYGSEIATNFVMKKDL